MSLLPPPLGARVPGPELMDDFAGIGGDELRGALDGLRTINRRLGGLATTRKCLDDLASRVELGTAVDILDAGGGSGDAAETMIAWGRERGIAVRVVVLDLHADTAAEAARRLADVPGASARQGDLFSIEAKSFDIVHAALFLHHFDGADAARALAAMARIARKGIVVNDLHRHWVPWMLIRWLTLAFSRNRLIRADGPLSVARAFTAEDWKHFGSAAGLELRWRRSWAWRWAVTGVHVP